jgi:hypothetical protein
MIDIKKIGRYNDLYHRLGVMDHSFTGMEWMEEGYDSRTLKEVTESCSAVEFLSELFFILLISTPNYNALAHSLGVFDWKNNALFSKEVFNKWINKIIMYPLADSTAYREELGKITIELIQHSFMYSDAVKLLTLHKFEIQSEDGLEVITAPFLVKRIPSNEPANMIVSLKTKDRLVTSLDVWYEIIITTASKRV